jgi:two-component system, OmpR family, sensor kinase ParS
MKRFRRGRLLFRTYLIIVGGLVATAAVFDYGFGSLQDMLAPPRDPLAEASLALIEARLAAAAAAERPGVARDIQRELGFPVQFLAADAVVHAGDAPAAATSEVFDALGRSIYLRSSAALGGSIRVGPVGGDEPPNDFLRFVPHLFYLAIFVLVAVWLWPLIRDVDLLTGAAHDFAADYRRPMATQHKASTLRDLAASFDHMAARIASLIQGQKDLTSALSHEIRTPLARIKFAMAVMESKTSVDGELDSIEQDVREIDRLIATMLEFARLDHPDTQLNWQLTPADAWLQAAASKVLLRDGQAISHSAPSAAIRMDPDRMALAASNLLVNACRYANRQVAIALEVGENAYALAVEDDGPGIPEGDREKVFKAFTRLDDSRSRGTGGYGLGLAIVARIAALHGGAARVETSKLGGARIVIAWPRAQGTAPTPG